MPIYEYQCESCGHRQDALQKVSDPPLTDCAACGTAALRKLVSAPRFRLKGSGWYETDFKQENRRNLADGSDGAKSADGGAGAPGSDSSGTGSKAAGADAGAGADKSSAGKGSGASSGSSAATTGE